MSRDFVFSRQDSGYGYTAPKGMSLHEALTTDDSRDTSKVCILFRPVQNELFVGRINKPTRANETVILRHPSMRFASFDSDGLVAGFRAGAALACAPKLRIRAFGGGVMLTAVGASRIATFHEFTRPGAALVVENSRAVPLRASDIEEAVS